MDLASDLDALDDVVFDGVEMDANEHSVIADTSIISSVLDKLNFDELPDELSRFWAWENNGITAGAGDKVRKRVYSFWRFYTIKEICDFLVRAGSEETYSWDQSPKPVREIRWETMWPLNVIPFLTFNEGCHTVAFDYRDLGRQKIVIAIPEDGVVLDMYDSLSELVRRVIAICVSGPGDIGLDHAMYAELARIRDEYQSMVEAVHKGQ